MWRSDKDQPPDAPSRVAIPKPHASPVPTPQPSIASQDETIARRIRSIFPIIQPPPPILNKSTDTAPIPTRMRSQTAAITSVITPYQAAQRRYPDKFLQSLEMPVLDKTSGKLLKYRQLRKHPKFAHIWNTSYTNELGRLCKVIGQGSKVPKNQRMEGTNNFHLIKFEDIPQDRKKIIIHSMVVCKVKPHKEDPNRTRIIVAGSQIC